jgi:hypothetical protein
MKDLEERIRKLAQWIFEGENIVFLTGAGISTEPGLPNVRGPEGIWTGQDKELPTKFRLFTSVEPNAGHRALVELQNLGKLRFLITQNVDNLHLRSGIRPELLAELHGNVNNARLRWPSPRVWRRVPAVANWFRVSLTLAILFLKKIWRTLSGTQVNVIFLLSSARASSSVLQMNCPRLP